MKNLLFKSALMILMFNIFLLACKTSKTTESKYVGEWHYTFDYEGTEYAAYMTINKVESGYTGSLTSEMGSVNLDGLVIEEDILKASYDIQGYILDLEGTFSGDTFNGLSKIDSYEFPMNAIRKQ